MSLDTDAWEAFVEMRKAKGKRAPFTAAAEKRIGFELLRLQADGHDTAEVLWQSVVNGWSGVFPLKGKAMQQITVPNPQATQTTAWMESERKHREAVESERMARIARKAA